MAENVAPDTSLDSMLQRNVISTASIHAELSPHIQCVKDYGIQSEDFENKTSEDASVFSIVNKSEEQQFASSVGELLSILRSSANSGTTLTRFKGLAEMNTKQLRETTMQIDARVLLQVTIEDAVQAERMFTLLMGDSVEPRRAFIERYGTQVELDVYGA